ncbi:glycosyltransferase family 2 protein [Armatimonas rosea]|uniref:Dolichol-phosphate mannosyltransferase n=1 Tax=Armatimonas rosea TaxID=685828 RepID=A0A7W9SR57_ARMRO|nr:glycosyltransferase family 2 protein [Armatimonas rosea]MBB6051305.1 dolichol-phosphate mannosyltransferase [Armatimonas rosea]
MALISLVFPIFNEEAVLPVLVARLEALLPILEKDGDTVEVLFVNDGSRDSSLLQLRELAQKHSWARVLSLSRNFGHQIAVTAGMHHATGDAVVLLDADLQDPPELLPEMIRLWRDDGWEVVYGKRRSREGETAFKLLTASLFYKLLHRLTSVAIPENTGDFRLMDRKVVDALNAMGEQHRFLRGMAAWVGFKQYALEYDRPARAAGETKYPFRKMFKLAMDAVTGFSYAPLKLSRDLGAFIALGAIVYGVIQAVRYALAPRSFEPGWTSIIVVLSLLSGVQLVTLGLIGEYIGRIYDEVKGRPLYLLSEKLGFQNDAQSTNSKPS